MTLPMAPSGDVTWMVNVLNDTSGPLAVAVIQPDSENLWDYLAIRLRRVGVGRISPREWRSLTFSDSPCTVQVARPDRLVRLFTGHSSLYAMDLTLTPRWMAAATGRGRVMFGLVPPDSLPDSMIDIDLTADPDVLAQFDRLAAERHLLGALARLDIE